MNLKLYSIIVACEDKQNTSNTFGKGVRLLCVCECAWHFLNVQLNFASCAQVAQKIDTHSQIIVRHSNLGWTAEIKSTSSPVLQPSSTNT